MWIPAPLYERAPSFWLWIGLFLAVVGVYLGIQVQRWYMYVGIGLGLASCAWSALTFWQRALQREKAQESAESA